MVGNFKDMVLYLGNGSTERYQSVFLVLIKIQRLKRLMKEMNLM